MPSRRNLTHKGGENEDPGLQRPHSLIPVVTVEPPASNESEEDEDLRLSSSTTNLYRPELINPPKKEEATRPKLSLLTERLDGTSDKRQHSASSITSHIRDFISDRRNSRVSDTSEPRSNRTNRSESTDDVPRSAKVISLVGEDEFDDFKDLQDGFKNALGESELTWLPKLKEEEEQKLSDNERERNETHEEQQSAFFSDHDRDTQENDNRRSDVFLDQAGPYLEDIELSEMNSVTMASQKNTFGKSTQKQPPSEQGIISTKSGVSGAANTEEYSSKKNNEAQGIQEEITFELSPSHQASQQATLYGKSLGIISPHNVIREKLASIILNKKFKILSQIMLLLLTILLSYRTYHAEEHNTLTNFGSNQTDIIIVIMNVFFTLELIAKVVAFGFWDDSQMFQEHGKEYTTILERTGIVALYRFLESKYGENLIRRVFPIKIYAKGDENLAKKKLKSSVTFVNNGNKRSQNFQTPRAFARSSWNRVDLVSTVSYWIGLFLSFNDYDFKHGVRIFKTLGALRILRLTDTDTGLSSILKSLKYGLPQLLNVGFMLLYFWVLFGILGVQSFQGSFRRQCVWYNPDDSSDTYEYDMQFCGGYLEPITKAKMNYIFDDGKAGAVSKGFLCPQYSKCISSNNPYNGRISFDNIVNSMELVFVVMSANTFTDLMYYTMDSDNMATSLFFIFSIFFLTIWMMNLLIAVLVSSFEIANEMFRKKRKDMRVEDNFNVRTIKKVIHFLKSKSAKAGFPKISQKATSIYERIECVFVVLIAADLIAQATLTARSSESKINNLLKFEQAVTAALFCETLLRLAIYAPNIWRFLLKPSYVCDLIISIITLVVVIPKIREKLGESYNWLSFFQILRIYRVIISFKITRNLWKRVLGNAVMIWNLSSFYFFFLFITSIIVSIYFEGSVSVDDMDEIPFGMYSLPNSFLSLFIIGSTENWTEILYNLQANSPNKSSALFGSVLLILWFILSNSVILNVFIAVIAESLDVEEEKKRPLQIKHYLEHVYPEKIKEFTQATLLARIKKKFFGKRTADDSRDFRQFLFRGTAILSIAQNYDQLTENNKENDLFKDTNSLLENALKRVLCRLSLLKFFSDNPFYKKPTVIVSETNTSSDATKKYALQLNEFEDEKLEYLRQHPSYNNTYFIFPPNHVFRKFCQSLVPPSIGKRSDGRTFIEDDTNTYYKNHYFIHLRRDLFVIFTFIATLIMIVFSCYITPLYRMERNMGIWNWSVWWEAGFVTLFTLEFIIKTVADGVFYTPNAYLRSPWNCIDAIVLISMWANFIAWLKNDGNLSRIFRGLTALRALRCLTVSNTARNTFNLVIFDGLTKIFGACVVSLSLLFPFTVWGLKLFNGRLGVCNDGAWDKQNCYNEFSNTVFKWDILMPRVYEEPYLHMNSFSSAFRSLYEIVSLEGWTDLLANLMNSTGVGTPAETFSSPQNAIFLVLFNFLSMVFILTLFISFIVSNHAKTTGSAFYTIEEKSWLEVQKLLSQVKPEPTPNVLSMSRFRRFCYMLAVEKTNFYYALFLQLMLYLHILTLLLRAYQESYSMRTYENVLFMISTSVFFLQEIMYVYGKGIRLFATKRWDIFRIVVVVTSFSLNIGQVYFKRDIIGFTNAQSFFQLIIFLFVIPQNDILTELIGTAVASIPSILSLTYTWGILFLVYAIALNQIFGMTKLGSNTTGNINFRTVTKTLLVLFRCSFGEGWNYIMADLTVHSPFCYSGSDSSYTDCGSKPYAYTLLMSWNVLSMYIFLNMFISLIIENFSYVYHRGGTKSVTNREEIRKFRNAWKKFDSDGVGQIEFSFLPKLMHSFDGPLSFKIWEGRLTVKNLVKNYMKVNPDDPYDVEVDLPGLNRELHTIHPAKIIQRRLQYKRFIQEAHMLNSQYGAIKFSKILLQIPLYTTYNPRECLGIDQYVRNLYIMGKVDRFLDNQRNVDVLEMIVTRWKYLSEKRKHTKHVQNPFLDDIPQYSEQEKGKEFSRLVASSDDNVPSTPVVNYGVNNFMWSPRITETTLGDPDRRALLSDQSDHDEEDSDAHTEQLRETDDPKNPFFN